MSCREAVVRCQWLLSRPVLIADNEQLTTTTMNQKLTVLDRVTLPTPRFFRKVRTIGAALAAVGGIIATAPVALPAVVVTLGGYLVLAGSVAAAVSSAAVDPDGDLQRGGNRERADTVREVVERGDAASL